MQRMNYFGPARMRQPVEEGRVVCPVHGESVEAQRCMTCSFLAEALPDERGPLATIVCRPPLASLAGRASAHD